MENLEALTLDELVAYKERFVERYIGDFDKPVYYNGKLQTLNRLILKKKKML